MKFIIVHLYFCLLIVAPAACSQQLPEHVSIDQLLRSTSMGQGTVWINTIKFYHSCSFNWMILSFLSSLHSTILIFFHLSFFPSNIHLFISPFFVPFIVPFLSSIHLCIIHASFLSFFHPFNHRFYISYPIFTLSIGCLHSFIHFIYVSLIFNCPSHPFFLLLSAFYFFTTYSHFLIPTCYHPIFLVYL
jgi:hypothetical protein